MKMITNGFLIMALCSISACRNESLVKENLTTASSNSAFAGANINSTFAECFSEVAPTFEKKQIEDLIKDPAFQSKILFSSLSGKKFQPYHRNPKIESVLDVNPSGTCALVTINLEESWIDYEPIGRGISKLIRPAVVNKRGEAVILLEDEVLYLQDYRDVSIHRDDLKRGQFTSSSVIFELDRIASNVKVVRTISSDGRDTAEEKILIHSKNEIEPNVFEQITGVNIQKHFSERSRLHEKWVRSNYDDQYRGSYEWDFKKNEHSLVAYLEGMDATYIQGELYMSVVGYEDIYETATTPRTTQTCQAWVPDGNKGVKFSYSIVCQFGYGRGMINFIQVGDHSKYVVTLNYPVGYRDDRDARNELHPFLSLLRDGVKLEVRFKIDEDRKFVSAIETTIDNRPAILVTDTNGETESVYIPKF